MLKEIFNKLRKSGILKRYAYQLSALLERRYGPSEFYTVTQVRRTCEEEKISTHLIQYAYALYCKKDDFDKILKDQPYELLRSEIRDKYPAHLKIGESDFPRQEDPNRDSYWG